MALQRVHIEQQGFDTPGPSHFEVIGHCHELLWCASYQEEVCSLMGKMFRCFMSQGRCGPYNQYFHLLSIYCHCIVGDRSGDTSPEAGGELWINVVLKLFPLWIEGLEIFGAHQGIFRRVHDTTALTHNLIQAGEQTP